jgi:hypothetical protein
MFWLDLPVRAVLSVRILKWSRHLVDSEAASLPDSVAEIEICLTLGWSSYSAARTIYLVDINKSSECFMDIAQLLVHTDNNYRQSLIACYF